MLAWRHGGTDPFELYQMDRRRPGAGRPASPKRYKLFIMACAAVANEYAMHESGVGLGGTPQKT